MMKHKLSENINVGYRAESKGFGTEGNGIYVALTEDSASFFGDKLKKVYYNNPSHPLIVNEEPLLLLHEDARIMEPIQPTDSVWVKLNKQAVINSGVTNENWNIDKVCNALTDLLKQNNYDMVRVTSDKERWDIILNPNLIVKTEKT
jgi:hypothetical protein